MSGLDRRLVLQALVAVAFGGPALAHDMATMDMGKADAVPSLPKVTPFAPQRHDALDRLVDLVIPKTDTAGAKEAGVTSFIELMYEHWMIDAERQRCDAELDLVMAAFATGGDPIPGLYTDGRFKAPLLRKLTIYGYYTSQVGGSEELDLNLAPGFFDACAAITPDDRPPSLSVWGIGFTLASGASS